MQIIGMCYTMGEDGARKTTIHVVDEFDSYYKTADNRGCVGRKVETIYVGGLDCSHLKVGAIIEIAYDKAINTRKGIYQPVKRIDVIPAVRDAQPNKTVATSADK